MADALCGPSNPVQSFRKHTQLDRTLQQDRLGGRPNAPSQGFRSHDPRTGSLDADIHAFENTLPPNPLEFQQPPAFFQQHPQQQQPRSYASGGWAADFQRMHISQTPSPVPVSQFRTEAPLVKSTNGGWHNDFLRQSGNVTPVTASLKGKEVSQPWQMQPKYQFETQGASDMDAMHPEMMTPFQPAFQMQSRLFEQHGVNAPLLDTEALARDHVRSHELADVSDEAFEAAFQDAFIAEAQALQQQQPSPILHAEQGHDIEMTREDVRIGSDAINYTEVKDRTLDQDTHDADDLASTAGQLLNLVQHDTSQKFQNSQFLDLMRKLRDREVEVQNNDMVSSTTGTSLEQQQTSTANVEQHQDQDPYPAATASKENQWLFPDMNDIYAPTNNELDTASHSYSGTVTPNARNRFPGSWDYPITSPEEPLINGIARPSSVPPVSTAQVSDPMYQTGSDEFPATQIQALHPGGKFYPHSPQQQSAEMSGGVS